MPLLGEHLPVRVLVDPAPGILQLVATLGVPRPTRLVTTAVAADHCNRAARHAAPAVGPRRSSGSIWTGSTSRPAGSALHSRATNCDRRESVVAVVELIITLYALGPLPHRHPAAWDDAEHRDDRRRRHGRSTPPCSPRCGPCSHKPSRPPSRPRPPSFTAKAQELMSRHSIDAALAWAESIASELSGDDPLGDRRAIRRDQGRGCCRSSPPHNRCRAVRHVEYGFVVGTSGSPATSPPPSCCSRR